MSIILAIFLKENSRYKVLLKIVAAGVAVSFSLVSLCDERMPGMLVVVILIIADALHYSATIPTFQLMAEVVYPLSEVWALAIMNVIGKTFTLFMSIIANSMTDSQSKYSLVLILCICLAIIGLIPAYAVDEDLRRMN